VRHAWRANTVTPPLAVLGPRNASCAPRGGTSQARVNRVVTAAAQTKSRSTLDPLQARHVSIALRASMLWRRQPMATHYNVTAPDLAIIPIPLIPTSRAHKASSVCRGQIHQLTAFHSMGGHSHRITALSAWPSQPALCSPQATGRTAPGRAKVLTACVRPLNLALRMLRRCS
jgi:hypothetical protein